MSTSRLSARPWPRAALSLISAFAIALAVSSTAQASPNCSPAPTNGLVARSVSGGNYSLYVPSGLSAAAQLVVVLHGSGGNPAAVAGYTPFMSDAASKKAIIAYPDAGPVGWMLWAGSPDVAFVRSVVADVEASYCIDPKHVYATGHSSGAYMAQRLACEAADLFASVAVYAGGDPFTSGGCSPSRPITVALYGGTGDNIVPPSAIQSDVQLWVAREHCGTTPTTQTNSQGVFDRYAGCDGSVEIRDGEYTGEGHLWPAASTANYTDLDQRIWDVFATFPLP